MKLVSIFLLAILVSSCKDHYNDTISWTDSIKLGTTIEAVKKDQPKFLEIDWDKPEVNGDEEKYHITSIKGNNDVLNMTNYLVFVDGKYQGRFSMK